MEFLEMPDVNSLRVLGLGYYVHNEVNQNSSVICRRRVGLGGIPHIHEGK